MFVGQFQIRQCQLVLLLTPMEICTEDQELSMIGVYFQSFLDLQLALLHLVLDQIIFGLFVQFLQLGSDHLDEQSHLSIVLVYLVCVPKLFVPFGQLRQAPVNQSMKDQQISVSLVNHYAVLYLIESQLSLVYLEISKATPKVIAYRLLFFYFIQHFLVEYGVSLHKDVELSVSKDVLDAAYLQQLQSLHLGQKFDLFQCGGTIIELMGSSIKDDSARNITILLINLCQFQHVLGILLQEQDLVIGLNGLAITLLSFQISCFDDLVGQTFTDDFILGSLFHYSTNLNNKHHRNLFFYALQANLTFDKAGLSFTAFFTGDGFALFDIYFSFSNSSLSNGQNYFYSIIWSECSFMSLQNQGWSSNSCIVMRVLGFTSRQRFNTDRQSGERLIETVGLSLYLPVLMASMVQWAEDPLKGSSPKSIPQRMTPVDQTSSLPSIFWFLVLTKHQGAIYARLPVSRSSHFRVEMAPAIPKSIIFIFFYSRLTNRTFYSFKSRWVKLFLWQYSIPRTICLIKSLAVPQSSFFIACTYLKRSPPSRYSMMMTTSIFLRVRHLWTLTMLTWLRDLSISASMKMESISLTEPIFSVLMILIAKYSLVCLCLARKTLPKPPYPSILVIQYSAKQLAGSNYSPLEAYSTDLLLTKSRSSSKHQEPSE